MGSAIVCPEAGEAVPFRIKTDAKTVVQAWNHFVRVRCPHCGEPHPAFIRKCTWRAHLQDSKTIWLSSSSISNCAPGRNRKKQPRDKS